MDAMKSWWTAGHSSHVQAIANALLMVQAADVPSTAGLCFAVIAQALEVNSHQLKELKHRGFGTAGVG